MKLPDGVTIRGAKQRSNLVEYAPTEFGTIHFYPGELMDEKDWTGFIKKTESVARRSVELKSFIQYLKDELKMDSCHFFKNVNNADVSVELHHYPFGMFDICEIIARKRIINNEPFSTFEVANEVTRIHFEKLIGLVPLSKTLHQLAHSGKLLIPVQTVFGDVKGFIEQYKRYITRDMLHRIKAVLEVKPEEIVRINKQVLDEEIIFNPMIENDYKEDMIKLIEEKTNADNTNDE